MLAVRAALDAPDPRGDGVDGKRHLRLRRGLELRRGRRRRPLRAGHAAQHGRHRHRDLQRPAPRRRARRRALRREPAGPGLRLRAAHRPERRPGQRGRRDGAAGRACSTTWTRSRSGWPATSPTTRFVDRTGATVTGSEVDYNGSPPATPPTRRRTILYVSAHDNETLFDSLALKLPQGSVDGRPGAHAAAVAVDGGPRAGRVVLPRRHRHAPLEVPRPEQLRLR